MANRNIHLRDKARSLREKGMRLPEIVDKLKIGKSTAWYWIKDIPVAPGRSVAQTEAQRKGTQAMVLKYKRARRAVYKKAYRSAREDLRDQSLRDFVVMYMGEGIRAHRNLVALANGNPSIVLMSYRVLKNLTDKHFSFMITRYVDHDEEVLRRYWGNLLGVDPSVFYVHMKSNSSNLGWRANRCQYGVCRVSINSTELRARIQAWMDYITAEWAEKPPVDSPVSLGV